MSNARGTGCAPPFLYYMLGRAGMLQKVFDKFLQILSNPFIRPSLSFVNTIIRHFHKKITLFFKKIFCRRRNVVIATGGQAKKFLRVEFCLLKI